MTKNEAMRRVCASAAALLDNDGENLWAPRSTGWSPSCAGAGREHRGSWRV